VTDISSKDSFGQPVAASPSSPLLQSRLEMFRERDELPRLFAIVTWGHAATGWLAKVLNSHPEIFCVHHLRARMGLILPEVSQVSDENLLAALRVMGVGYSLAGDVHGIDRLSVPRLQEILGAEFAVAGLIREPLARLQSHFAREELTSYHAANRDLSYLTRVPGFEEIRPLLTGAPERSVFVHCANMLNNIVDETAKLPRIFRFEDVTTSPQALRELVRHISGGTIEAAEDFAANAVGTTAFNRHRKSAHLKFEPWQIGVIKAIVRPEAWRKYVEFGYATPDF
jgi:hypothetical protein